MSSNLKKLLLSLGILVTAGVFAFLLYYLFFRAPVVVPPEVVPPGKTPIDLTPGATGTPPGQATTPTGTVTPTAPVAPTLPLFTGQTALATTTVLSEIRAQNMTLVPGTSGAAFYDPTTGQFYRITAEGKIERISDRTFFGVSDVTWAPKTDKAILEFPDGSKILYNFSTNTQVTLPKHWEGFTFDPEGSKIAAKSMAYDAESRWLFISNADGSQATPIQSLGTNGDLVDMAWSPSNQIIAFARTGDPRDGSGQEIIPLGQNNENFKALIVPGYGFESAWSPDGQKLLFSVYNQDSGYRPTLWITNGSSDQIGNNRQSLKLQTWADKCTFQSSTVLFCAVPSNLEQGAALERSLFEAVPDAIYKIDLTTGSEQLIVQSGSDAVTSMSATSDGRYLFYTDQASGRIHKVELKP
ncbi:MAG: hypothetical protein V1821_01195 [bacterium]